MRKSQHAMRSHRARFVGPSVRPFCLFACMARVAAPHPQPDVPDLTEWFSERTLVVVETQASPPILTAEAAAPSAASSSPLGTQTPDRSIPSPRGFVEDCPGAECAETGESQCQHSLL